MRVTDDLFIDEADLSERFILAQGPGGQNANKVSSAVELRFDLARNRSLPEAVRLRLAAQARRYLAQSGEIILVAQRFRDQPRNRADARARLAALVLAAAAPPKERPRDPPDARLGAPPAAGEIGPRRRQSRPLLARGRGRGVGIAMTRFRGGWREARSAFLHGVERWRIGA